MRIPFLSKKDDVIAVPAYKETPAGVRVGLVAVDGVAWELIDHKPVLNLTLRQLDDRDAVHPTLITTHSEAQAWAYDNGELLGKKKLGEILTGNCPEWPPGSFLLAQDNENKEHFYVAKIVDLVKLLKAQVQAAADLGPETKAPEAKS